MLRLGFACLFAGAFGALATVLGFSVVVPRLLQAPTVSIERPAAVGIVPQPRSDTTLHHLPEWVQTHQAAPLWSGPDKQAVQLTQLPAWTFLKVTGARADRLQVLYAGDGAARQPGPGWVSASDVQPSDPSGSWLRNHRATRLFADASGATATADIGQWSWMLRLDSAPSH